MQCSFYVLISSPQFSVAQSSRLPLDNPSSGNEALQVTLQRHFSVCVIILKVHVLGRVFFAKFKDHLINVFIFIAYIREGRFAKHYTAIISANMVRRWKEEKYSILMGDEFYHQHRHLTSQVLMVRHSVNFKSH